jgi:transcription elongation factor Elf1
MEYDFSWVYCPECNITLVFECRLEKDGERTEMVVCPRCGVELGEIRADHGCDCIGMACGYIYPGKPCCGGGY